jgi:signal transduction histidine kinase
MRVSNDHTEFVFIDIIDHGIGISEEDQLRLFERFFRADASCNIPGTGLGLSIVKEIMNNMGGDILFESVVNSGSTFTLVFKKSTSPVEEVNSLAEVLGKRITQIG